jgi:hypothetical protein
MISFPRGIKSPSLQISSSALAKYDSNLFENQEIFWKNLQCNMGMRQRSETGRQEEYLKKYLQGTQRL